MAGAEPSAGTLARLAPAARLAAEGWLAGFARVAAGLAGLAAAVGAMAVAAGPGRFTTYAGSSAGGDALTVCAGLGLTAAGLVMWLARLPGRGGDLALLAGLCWFAPVWVAWPDGPPLVPSTAMVAAAFTFPLVVHLVLAYPTGRIGSTLARALVAVAYGEALFTAVLLALFRDPYFDPDCLANCTVNSFLVRSLPALARAVESGDRWFTAAVAAALVVVCAVRLTRASWPARQRLLPAHVPAIGFAAAVAARSVALQWTTGEDPFNPVLFTIFAFGCAAMMLLAAGLMSGVARGRAERRAVTKIAALLDQAPAPGSLQSALAAALRDPGLRIAYWLPGRRSYIDASGQVVPEPSAAPGRAVTRLTRNEHTIAAVSHSAVVSGIEGQIGAAIRLGLENERLQAELLAQLDELRASRARVVEAADGERRGLERNLHDGAQQHLLALSYDIRLARAAAQADGDDTAEMALARAAEDAQEVLGELRDLAHGIYPAVLAEAGIGPALASLADTAPLPVEILIEESRRHPAPVEAAAYFAVAEAIGDAARRGADWAGVRVAHEGGLLVVTVEDNGSGEASPMLAAADRVGALGGGLATGPTGCRMEIPCAS
jgi:signal transduction histidine kinase